MSTRVRAPVPRQRRARHLSRRARAATTCALGFLVHERPLSRRHVYRYLRACEPVELEVTLLSAADRLATRGARTRQEAIEEPPRPGARARRARRSPGAPSRRRAAGARRRADAGSSGSSPGPRSGRLLELLREAAFAGEVCSRDEALELRARAASAARAPSLDPALVQPPDDRLGEPHAVGERVVVDVRPPCRVASGSWTAPCSRSPSRGRRTGSRPSARPARRSRCAGAGSGTARCRAPPPCGRPGRARRAGSRTSSASPRRGSRSGAASRACPG